MSATLNVEVLAKENFRDFAIFGYFRENKNRDKLRSLKITKIKTANI